MAASCVDIVKKFFPNTSTSVANYINSMLTDGGANDYDNAEDLYNDIIQFFRGPAFRNETDNIKKLCDDLLKLMKTGEKQESFDLKPLENPLVMNETILEAPKQMINQPEIYKMRTVDEKKLRKAEEKLKAKSEKKENKVVKPKEEVEEVMATVSQQTDRKVSRLDANSDIKLEDFDVSYGEKTLLQNANLTLSRGRIYGLVGRNGVGKTTLLRMIASGGLKIPNCLRILHVEQEVKADDTPVLQSVLESDERRNNLLAMEKELLKEGTSSEKLQAVYAEMASIDADSAPARAAAILCGLGFDNDAQQRKTSEFSGGWRMRLALARSLFSQPDLLLLDEPTNMLDMKTIAWLEDYLHSWKSTVFLVSHDRAFLTNVCTDTLHMIRRQLIHYRGDYEVFEKTREEREKNQKKEYEAQVEYRQHIQVFIDRFRYNANRASQVQSKIKHLEKLPKLIPVEPDPAVVFRFPDCDPPSGGAAVQLDEVKFKYDNSERVILRDVSINATPDARVCIVGDNGAGKSTLIKLLLNELVPTGGERKSHRHCRFAYFAQHHIDRLDLDMNPVQVLQSVLPGKPVEFYRSKLGGFGVSGDMALRTVRKLSGGQKSRVAFAMMTLSSPNFLVLDEPTNHLDMDTIDALSTAIDNFAGAVILVTHDQKLVKRVCKELWLVADGHVKIISGGMDEYTKLVKKQLQQLNPGK